MKGVLDLCLHTALAHVRFTVGDAFPTLSYICDDNIEGTVAELNRYFNRRRTTSPAASRLSTERPWTQ